MLVAAQLPGIVIHGTKGSFVKVFCDRQEDQSIAGMSPDNAAFGTEAPGMEGELTLIAADGSRSTEKVASEKGNMMGIFESAYYAVRGDADFAVQESEVLAQLNILEA
ncbi:MAG: hypothetical protein EOP45_06485 [Sphingobacteriaceae bacterium]|nr:MAG: hypothetical protein EOP45_06485 [Sphingobacteriaceae bacterium]